MSFETVLKSKYDINPATYMQKARKRANSLGYNLPLSFATDGTHKLEYDGIKFGNQANRDFIIYSLTNTTEKAKKMKKAYWARMFAQTGGREITKKMKLTKIIW